MPDYPPGTPCWIDLTSPDPDASERFYKELFGWETEYREDPEKTGGYRTITSNGKSLGGLFPIMQEGQPPAWSTYIATADADDTAAKVKDSGGQIIAEPMDVLDLGRMCVFVDPTGASCGVWQQKKHTGAETVNRVGTWGWNELQTRDLQKASEFYGAVFGWQAEDTQMSETYKTWKSGDRMVGGVMQMDENFPPDIPSNWLVYFMVEDADAAADKAKAGDGNVHVEPTDIPGQGRFTVITDPHGAVFAAMAANPEASEQAEQYAAELGA